jgi:hypothetical protein
MTILTGGAEGNERLTSTDGLALTALAAVDAARKSTTPSDWSPERLRRVA